MTAHFKANKMIQGLLAVRCWVVGNYFEMPFPNKSPFRHAKLKSEIY